MRFSRFRSLFVGCLFSLAVVLGLGAAGATNTMAQRVVVRPRVFVGGGPAFGPWGWGWGWGPPYYGYSRYYYDPIAYQRERGFSDGFNDGKSDARHGKVADPNSHKHYRNSDSMAYRNAFVQGYNTGFKDQRVR